MLWIRIWIFEEFEDDKPKCREGEPSRAFFKISNLYFEAIIRIRIRIKVKGRVRIRIKGTSRIRIRIEVMHIRNQCCGSGMFIPDPGS
jgi:hypothetical protein